MLLHGYSATGNLQDVYLGVSARGDDLGFISLIPEGTADARGNQFWNVGIESAVDDTAYLAALIAEAVSGYNADPGRVYIVGHSNGGFMANKLACEVPELVTGIASLAGGIVGLGSECDAATNVLTMHGTADIVVPYDGGLFLGTRILGATTTTDRWTTANGCGDPAVEPAADFDLLVPGAETERSVWSDCATGRWVELWTMEGSGHIPGLRPAFRTALLERLLTGR